MLLRYKFPIVIVIYIYMNNFYFDIAHRMLTVTHVIFMHMESCVSCTHPLSQHGEHGLLRVVHKHTHARAACTVAAARHVQDRQHTLRPPVVVRADTTVGQRRAGRSTA